MTVSDKEGPVTSLDKSNFHLESDPAVIQLAAVTKRHHSPRAMLVIDVSDSMRKPGKLKVVSSLGRGFVDAASPGSPLALITFSDKVNDRLDFSTPKEVFLQKLQALGQEPSGAKGGRTALYDAIIEAMRMFDGMQPGDVVFLISDGGDNRSHAKMREVKKLLLKRGLRLFCFVPLEDDHAAEEQTAGPDSLANVSEDTGGRSFALGSDPRMWGWDNSKPVMARNYEMGKYMYVLAASGYELDVTMQHPIQKPVSLKLKIVGPDGGVVRNVQALYPKILTPCAITEQN